ncbi:MAG: hypothetical protein IJ187_08155 [Neisseriaceae bacterium]|nr:hypothetical protein [Neisseriaceae bacterium]
MMKKQHKSAKFALTALAFSLFATPTMAKDITISQEPLLGVSKITPSVVLALSVEFPTAGIAYSTKNSLSAADLKDENGFIGYFDNTKCYEYVLTQQDADATNTQGLTVGGYKDSLHGSGAAATEYQNTLTLGDGYFKPTSDAKTINGYQGLCEGSHEWSGNMMNFMTMSAVDIVRQTLTGGNRAKGVGADSSVYSDGDPAGENVAYLRRAMMWTGTQDATQFPSVEAKDQLSNNVNKLRKFENDIYSTQVNGKPLLDYLVPEGFSNSMAKIKQCSFGANGSYQDPFGVTHKRDNNNCDKTGRIVFWNSGTGFYATLYDTDYAANPAINGGSRIYQSARDTAKLENDTSSQARWFNVVVKAENKPEGLLQKEGMRTAVMGYLPEYQNTPGTTNRDNSAGDGGVLRATMRSVKDKELNTDGSFKTNPDGATEGNSGVVNYVNKFGDASPYDSRDPVAELYYTAIRYLRNGAWAWDGTDGKQKRQGSKGALPYTLPSNITEKHKDGFPVIKNWDDPMRAEGDKDSDMKCYSPAIIVLGDTNTHDDNNLPNYPTSSIQDNVALDRDGTTHYYEKTCQLSGFCNSTHPKAVGGWENQHWRVSSGSSDGGVDYAPTFGLAGMAYWVKTNDVRPDIDENNANRKAVHIQSFFIDVLEAGMLKTAGDLYSSQKARYDFRMQNSYYLAGKFASPTYDINKTYTRDDFDSENESTRSLWTSDPKGQTANESFPLGMPNNYAVANDPERMRKAIIKAFETVGISENTMQSGVQYNNAGSAQLNLLGKGSASLVSSGAIVANTDSEGKITGYTIKDGKAITNLLKTNPEQVPLTFRAGYNTTNWTGYLKSSVLVTSYQAGDTYGVTPYEVELWDAGQILFGQYHNDSTYGRRNVQSKASGTAETPTQGFMPFKAGNAASFSADIEGSVFEKDENFYKKLTASQKSSANLINYLLGDSTNEGEKAFRIRKGSLMGTSVYSSVTPILRNSKDIPVKGVPVDGGKECKYSTVRSGDYVATSSNEGMLHIFDMEGNEKYAYVPQTALPYIANYANPQYQHRYVNDGSSVLHEVCDGTEAASYLVGTSGRGASSIYAIRITDDNFTAQLEVNNKTDEGIGLLVSAPIVANQAAGGTGAPVMIFSSGYNNPSGKGYLFIYNLKTGTQIARVELGESGVGSPMGYDSNNDGIIDRIYVGDYGGKLWRISMKEPVGDKATWDNYEKQELFQAEGPILNRPAIGKVGNKTAILLGTGTYLSFDDMRAGTQNYGYGIFDDGSVSETITADKLHVQEFTKNTRKGENGLEDLTYYEITHNPIPDDAKGWRLVLPEGFTVTSDSAFYGPHNEIALYTATKINNTNKTQCEVTGETLLVAVDARNGGAYERPIFDVNNDYKFDSNDAAEGGYSLGAVSSGVVALGGTPAYTNVGVNYGVFSSGTKTIFAPMAQLPSGALKTRRVSWREIF